MSRSHYFAGVLAVSALNGVFSPYLLVVMALAPIWMPTWMPPDPSLLFYFSSLITATTTMMLAGVPAALLEAAVPRLRGTPAPMALWLAVTVILSIPAIVRFAGLIL